MKILAVLVLTTFTLNVFAQAVPTAPQASRSAARAVLNASGMATGQTYYVDGCPVPLDGSTCRSTSLSFASASLTLEAAPAETTTTTSTLSYATEPATTTTTTAVSTETAVAR